MAIVLLGALLSVAALMLLSAGALLWTARTSSGQGWLTRHVPGLLMRGVQGRMDGGPFSASRITWHSSTLGIEIDDLSWRDAKWRWHPAPGTWLGIELSSPHMQRIRIVSKPESDKARHKTRPPRDLKIPLEVALNDLFVASLQWRDGEPIQQLRGDVHLSDAGGDHRVRLQARYGPVSLLADAQVHATGGMPIQGRLQAIGRQGTPTAWQADAILQGTATQPVMAVQASMVKVPDALKARAVLSPFEAIPLHSLDATLQGLDLAALWPGLPATQLNGHLALAAPTTTARHVSFDVALDNNAAGAWTAGRMPLAHLMLAGDAQDGRVRITSLQWRPSNHAATMLVAGSGQWESHEAKLALEVTGFDPAVFDARWAPMLLSGTVGLAATGVPAPPGVQADGKPGDLRAEAKLNLSGRSRAWAERARADAMAGARSLPIEVLAQGSWAMPPHEPSSSPAWEARITQLALHTGASAAQATVVIRKQRDGAMRVQTEGRLEGFDPAQWWAGPEDASWRGTRNSIGAQWQADLRLPPLPAAPDAIDWMRLVRGTARIDVPPSTLAGVPLKAHASMDAKEALASAAADVAAGPNIAFMQVRVQTRQQPAWQARIDAPRLDALASWGRSMPAVSPWLPIAGRLQAKADAQGEWPAWSSRGTLAAAHVSSPAWSVADAKAEWAATLSDAKAPLRLSLDVHDGHWRSWTASRMQGSLEGSLSAHRLQWHADLVQRPSQPAKTQQALAQNAAQARQGKAAVVASAPSEASREQTYQTRIAATGAWHPGERCAGTWNGRVQDLSVVSPSAGTASTRNWLRAQALAGQMQTLPDCRLTQAALQPGEMTVLGSTLRWTQAAWHRSASGAVSGAIDARVLPIDVAPWLARLQPARQWQGDLRIGAQARLRMGDTIDGNALIERTGGDLRMQSPSGRIAMGLTALRVAANGSGGPWQIDEQLAGQWFGRLQASQRIVPAQGGIPDARATLEGSIDLKSADLATWTPLLPSPWTLQGRLTAHAQLAGTLGAPQYIGRIDGESLAVHNLLEGVDLRDGRLAVALRGPDAVIEQFTLRGGRGTVSVTGQADLGSSPQARLRVDAMHLTALDRVDRHVVLSGSATGLLEAHRLNMDGRIGIDEGLIDITASEKPRLDADVVLHRQGQLVNLDGTPLQPTAAGPHQPLPDNANVSLWLDLGDKLKVRGRGLETLLRGQLHMTAPQGRMAVNGMIRADGGSYTAYGQNLVMERGLITFTGDPSTPTLDILALRPDVDIRVGVWITGLAANPRVNLYSEPDMTDIDKLSWLVMGRAPEGLGQEDVALLQKAALALVAGQKGRPAQGGFVKRYLGLDELSLHRADSGNLGDTVVAMGRQLSAHWYVGYEQGLNATMGTWQLVYRIARAFSFRLSTGEDSAVDIIKTWRFN